MRSNLFFFVGLFAALLISWLGIVIGSNAQLGSLAPYYDDNDGSTHPEWLAGVAAQGQLEYKSLGCVACHTQQVRRPNFGSDQARGWGDRQSVARDYIYQPFPQLGLSRIGPDLTNVGDRKPPYDSDDLLTLLYSGAHGMPSYRFLFETRRLGANAQPSDKALKLTGALKPGPGWEIVPTRRAESLVGYLVNLKTTYTYPEAVPFVPAKPEGEAAKPAPAPAAAPAAPAPAPGISSAPAAAQAAATPTPTAAQTPPAASLPAPAATTPPLPAIPGPGTGVGPTPIASNSSGPPLTQPAVAGGPPLPAGPVPATSPAAGIEPTPTPPGGSK
jgi:cytochrome c oxidase cbb3-type subunit 2